MAKRPFRATYHLLRSKIGSDRIAVSEIDLVRGWPRTSKAALCAPFVIDADGVIKAILVIDNNLQSNRLRTCGVLIVRCLVRDVFALLAVEVVEGLKADHYY